MNIESCKTLCKGYYNEEKNPVCDSVVILCELW